MIPYARSLFGVLVCFKGIFQQLQLSGFCVAIWDDGIQWCLMESLELYYPKEMQEALLPLQAQTGARHHFKRDYREGGTGDENKEIVADDWFSPKLSHYQMGLEFTTTAFIFFIFFFN